MRIRLALCLMFLCAIGFAQENSSGSLFLTTRVDATVVVRKHNSGADLVTISEIWPDYPPELLRKQIAQIGKELNVEPRGVLIYSHQLIPGDAGSAVLKATFGINGLIDTENRTLHLQPILRGMSLEDGKWKFNGLLIQFEGEVPTQNTIKACRPPDPNCEGAAIEGIFGGAKDANSPYGVEYRVQLLVHDPSKISLPDGRRSTPRVKRPQKAEERTDLVLFGLLTVAAIALGALVYCLLLWRRRGHR